MPETVSIPLGFFEALSTAWCDDDLLRVCAFWLPGIIGADRISLAIMEENAFVFRAMTEDGNLDLSRQVDKANSVLGQVCQTGKPAIIRPDEAKEQTGELVFLRRLAESGYRHSMIIPLIAKDTLLGSLNASTRNADGFPPGALERAQAIGTWIAMQLLVRQQEQDMRRLAMLDPVTGLNNRRGFIERASAMFDDWRNGSREKLAVIVMDLDHFKHVNDTLGHAAGDAVLSSVGTCLQETLSPDAAVGRIGGEEFAAILPGSTCDAGRLAERLRDRIALPQLLLGRSLTVTASLGVAGPKEVDRAVDDVLNRADQALYDAKSGGRNQVRIAA